MRKLSPARTPTGVQNGTSLPPTPAGMRTLFVTVDVPIQGGREQELRHGMSTPPVLTPARVLDAAVRPRWWYGFLKHQRVSVRNLIDEGGVVN